MAQQQQQLAYAAVAAVLRKDVPNINDQQIREMVPLIYNANPAVSISLIVIFILFRCDKSKTISNISSFHNASLRKLKLGNGFVQITNSE